MAGVVAHVIVAGRAVRPAGHHADHLEDVRPARARASPVSPLLRSGRPVGTDHAVPAFHDNGTIVMLSRPGGRLPQPLSRRNAFPMPLPVPVRFTYQVTYVAISP